MVHKGYDRADRVLLSYDVSGAARSAAVRVCQIVFGRTRMDPTHPTRVRAEKGFIHRPGVVWIGQSVLALPARDADELRARLAPLGVRVAVAPVSIRSEDLEAFRRPR